MGSECYCLVLHLERPSGHEGLVRLGTQTGKSKGQKSALGSGEKGTPVHSLQHCVP